MNKYSTKKKKVNYKKLKVHPEAEVYDLCEWLNMAFGAINFEIGSPDEKTELARIENKKVVFEFCGQTYEVTKVKKD